MPKWTWPRVLELDLPIGWVVSIEENRAEAIPAGDHGAVHISVFWRSKGSAPRIGEAAEFVRDFAQLLKVTTEPEAERTRAGPRVSRLLNGRSKDGASTWDIEAQMWPDRAFVCTYVREAIEGALQGQVHEMWASIVPLDASPSKAN